MRKLVLSSFLGILSVGLFACSCITPPPFLEHIASDYFHENGGVIWEGDFIQHKDIPGTALHATQYQVRNIWCGSFASEIVVNQDPSNPFQPGTGWIDAFQITDDKVWVIGGDEATCLEWYGESNMLFATLYDDSFGPAYGYSTSLCSIDFFPISATNTVTGYIETFGSNTTMTIEELRGAVNSATEAIECDTANGIANISSYQSLHIFPNPVDDVLNFAIEQEFLSTSELSVFGIDGSLIFKTNLVQGQTSVALPNLVAGKYFTTLTNQAGDRFSGQFVK